MRWNVLLAALVALLGMVVLVTAEAPIEDPVWWYSNETPPLVTLEGPGGPLRGTAEAVLGIEPADRTRVVAATVDGEPLVVTPPHVVVDTTTLADGVHRLSLAVRDTSRRQNQSEAEWTFVSDNHGPALDVTLDPPEGPTEGHTSVIRVRPGEPTRALQATFEGRDVALQPDGDGGFWGVEGIPPEPAYRTVKLTVRAEDELGNVNTWEHIYPLVRTKFPEEVLDFDPTIDYLADTQLRAEEDARLMPVYRHSDGPARWDAPFRLPVQAPVTTEFATRRSYNGRYPEGNHAGLDLGAAMGTPVLAPAAGVVTFAAKSTARGNVIILDHGAGVFSTYAHLQRFDVGPGDVVRVGQVIGRVGSTGLSTGPHLHWEVWVDSANVDPLEWTKRRFP